MITVACSIFLVETAETLGVRRTVKVQKIKMRKSGNRDCFHDLQKWRKRWRFRCVFWLCQNDVESSQKRLCKYNLFFLCGICHLVVCRKIIRKVNDNDDGRAVMMFCRRCLVFAVVQAETVARCNAGALCSMESASSALKWEKDSVRAFAGAR